MRFLSYIVTKEDENSCIRDILKKRLCASSSLLKINKVRQGTLLNGKPVYLNIKPKSGDMLSLLIDDEKKGVQKEYSGAFPPDIIYEDEDILVINKPAGAVTHVSALTNALSVEASVKKYLNVDSFHAVNRLDKGTTGLMTIAKNGYIHTLLKNRLHTEDFIRNYIALCCGVPEDSCGVIELHIARDESSAIKRRISSDGAYAKTSYKVLSYNNGLSLVLLRAHTGRTHQLRLHMSAIGCPLLGDWLYGEQSELICRPALHSYSLRVRRPLSNDMLSLCCAPPEDILRLTSFPLRDVPFL